ncbi:MAG: hypothetical protein CUN55_16590, partial [Phototrophicales bacterium]
HQEVENILPDLEDEYKRYRLNNLAVGYRYIGDIERALNYYERALELARSMSRESAEGVMLSNISRSYRYLGEMGKSIKYAERALEIAEELGSVQQKNIRLRTLAINYQLQGDDQQAYAYFERALQLVEETELKWQISRTKLVFAYLLAEMGELEKAMQYIEGFDVERGEDAEADVVSGSSQLRLTLGQIYLTCGEVAKAYEVFEKHTYFADLLFDNQIIVLRGVTAAVLGDQESAQANFDRGIELSHSLLTRTENL